MELHQTEICQIELVNSPFLKIMSSFRLVTQKTCKSGAKKINIGTKPEKSASKKDDKIQLPS